MKLRLRSAILVTSALALFGVSSASAQTAAPPAAAEQDPAASKTGPISGYMDFHFNKLEGTDGVLDFHRFVLLFNHSFSPRIRFVGELELEHAFVEGLEESGEIELEQAYVDFLISRPFNVRAGMMLVPLGIINERHEPPVYNGVERPFVDTVIVPTTWFEVGAGIHGEFGRGFRYRAYAMAPLNALEFNAEEGIREGRQKGSEANVRNFAFTGRGEYVGVPDLTIGAGFWTGDCSFRHPAHRYDRANRRDRRALSARTPRAARTVRPGRHQRRGAAERRDRAAHRRLAERREEPARLLRRSGVPRVGRGIAPRSRGVRALRELRHAVPHAGRVHCR